MLLLLLLLALHIIYESVIVTIYVTILNNNIKYNKN